jgi:IPT/TIG domain
MPRHQAEPPREVTLAGRVVGNGDAVAGVAVELVHQDDVVATALTAADGRYRINLGSGRGRELCERPGTVLLRAVDATRTILSQTEVHLGKEPAVVRELDVPLEHLNDLDPVAKVLTRDGDSLLDPEPLRAIEAAFEISRHDYAEADDADLVRLLSPPLSDSAAVLNDAWGALEGDLESADRLRQTLESFGSDQDASAAFPADPPTTTGREAHSEPRISLPPPKRPCLLPPPRLIPIAAAALRIATSDADARRLLGGLQLGLSGLVELESLASDATEALRGDLRRFDASLSRLHRIGLLRSSLERTVPEPRPSFPHLELCGQLRDLCIRDIWQRLRAADDSAESSQREYVITSITPNDACPGGTITITGTEFGDAPGLVAFAGSSPAVPALWTDTEVRVVVPDDAIGGTLRLLIVEKTIAVCGDHAISIYRKGSGFDFDGGKATVYSLAVVHPYGRCVPPDKEVTILWAAVPSNAIVTLRVSSDGFLLREFTNLAASGSMQFTTPALPFPYPLTFEMITANDCGGDISQHELWVDVVPTLKIEGIEVTQGIQTFWRPGVSDNSLATIAGKDTIVRVYVSADRGGYFGDRVADVMVSLYIDGWEVYSINGSTPIDPAGATPFLTVGPRAAINRARTDDSFNFRIPAMLCTGTHALHVFALASTCGGEEASIAYERLDWTWEHKEAMPIRYVRVRDDRPPPAGTGQVPTDNQAWFTVFRAFDLLPTPATDIAPAWYREHDTTRDFETQDGIGELWRDLEGIYPDPAVDEHPPRWICLTALGHRGVANGMVSVAPIYEIANGPGIARILAAHEMSHNLGACHPFMADCQARGFTDEPLKDVPFDPYWNQTLIGTVYDYMSYTWSRYKWISPANWNYLRSVLP